MEAVGQVATAFNGRVLKEPRGFIKFIEFIVAIFAFATTTSSSTSSSFFVKCNTTTKTFSFDYSYPFDLTQVGVTGPLCNSTGTKKFQDLGESEASSAQFYVFVGVMAFLYCIGALILYIFFDDLYRKNNRVVIVDFAISIAFTALWLISSCAWAQGVTNVKYYTDPSKSDYFLFFPECGAKSVNCSNNSLGNFAGLNVSLIFGFLNVLVWGGNLWFLYKETAWFKMRNQGTDTPATTPQQPPVQPMPPNQF